jgi:hypothetical protein
MTSGIDSTKPVEGSPTTASVRLNFQTTKQEIEALQIAAQGAPFLSIAGGSMTGPMYLLNDPTDPRMPATKAYVDAMGGTGGGGTGIPEAPADGVLYGRRNGAWLQSAAPADITVAINAARPPDASETVKGLLRIATTAEANAGADNATAITPAKLAARLAAGVAPYLPLAGGTLTGNFVIAPTAPGASAALYLIKPDASGFAYIEGRQGGTSYWQIHLGQPNSGNFVIYRLAGANAGPMLTLEVATTFAVLRGVTFGQWSQTSALPTIFGATVAPTGTDDGLAIQVKRSASPVNGYYGDSAAILLRGPNYSANPNGIEFLTGNMTAGQKLTNIDANGNFISPAAGNFALGVKAALFQGSPDLSAGGALLQCWNSAHRVCFRCDNGNLLSYRVDEANNLQVMVTNNANSFGVVGGNPNPTTWVLYCYDTLFGSSQFQFFADIVSDERVKENVRASKFDALAALRSIQVNAFDYRAGVLPDPDDPSRRYAASVPVELGLLAQDVQAVIPSVVSVRPPVESRQGDDPIPDDVLCINKTELVPYLLRAVQQLADRLDAMGATT